MTIILTAPEAKTAKQTIRVMVVIQNLEAFQSFTIDLVLPLDGKPCRPKIDRYVSAEFPGYEVAEWWSLGDEF